MRKERYNIYGLSIIGHDKFFYIGVTKLKIEDRLANHFALSKNNSERNKRKMRVIEECKYNVSITLIKSIFSYKEEAYKLELETIKKYFNLGHPLTNRLPQERVRLITIKVTKETAKNFNVAAAMADKNQYEVSEEGSLFVLGKYSIKQKPKKN